MAGAVVPAGNWCLAGGLGAAGWKAPSNPVEQQKKLRSVDVTSPSMGFLVQLVKTCSLVQSWQSAVCKTLKEGISELASGEEDALHRLVLLGCRAAKAMASPTPRAMKRAKQLQRVLQVSLLPMWAFYFPSLNPQMHYSGLESKGNLFSSPQRTRSCKCRFV